MSKIKKIYTFGTSFTEGGGFEFDKPTPVYNNDDLYNFYSHLDEELTRENFCWPGQMKKICNDVEIINKAKSGYGNERLYRTAYEIIDSPDFKRDENLFLFEFSDVGRMEMYHNDIKDYIILNYYHPWPPKENDVLISGFANNYYYDSKEILDILERDKPLLTQYVQKSVDFYNKIELLNRNIKMFISFLEYNNIQYYIVSSDHINFNDNQRVNQDLVNSRQIQLDCSYDGNVEIFNDCMKLFSKYKLSIKDETGGLIQDGAHMGYFGNILLANLMVRFLIKEGKISESEVNLRDIDMKSLYNRNGII